MEQIVVGVGECAVADNPDQVLATFGLGSCIALALHDPVARVGGLAHYMLPDSGIESTRTNPYVFADTAIPKLVERMCRLGADRRRLRAHAAGGARMIPTGGAAFDIGRRNYEALLRELARAGLRLAGEHVGGAVSRNVRLAVGTGQIAVWQSGGRRGA